MKQLTSISLFLIVLCCVACSNSQTTTEKKETVKTETIKAKSDDSDLTVIKSIIEQLNKDYYSVLTDEEMALSVFYDNKGQYIDKYKAVLSSMDYMSDEFKDVLIKKLQNTTAGQGEVNLRQATDPLFETSMYAEKIVVTGSDIDEGMAAIGIELSYPLLDDSCCPMDLFFRKIDGKWMLTGHDILKSERTKKRLENLVNPVIGLFMKDGSDNATSYSLKMDKEQYYLEVCTPECTAVGKIVSLDNADSGGYVLGFEETANPNQTFILMGNQILVREDAGKEEIYTLVDAQG